MRCFRIDGEETEEGEGFSEQRRHLVLATPAVMAALLASPRTLVAALDEAESSAQIDAFLGATKVRALALKADDSAAGQDAYVKYLADRVTAVGNVPTKNLDDESWFGMDPGVYLGVAGSNKAFFVVHWKFDPGAFLPPHCHPKTAVCTLALEGSAVVRHFEAPADAPPYRTDRDTEFLVRETRRVELAAGQVSTLTEQRDNIHLFEAGPDGARGIDVTTDYGGDGSFSFLDFDRSRPADAAQNTYSARWIGRKLA